MKLIKLVVFVLISTLILSISVGNALAGSDEENKELVIADGDGNIKDNSIDEDSQNTVSSDSGSFLDNQVNKMNPAIRPFAQVVADNIVLIFNFIGAAAILGFGLWAAIEKKRGHTQQAAEAKHSATSVAMTLIWALILFNIFVALCKSSTFGI